MSTPLVQIMNVLFYPIPGARNLHSKENATEPPIVAARVSVVTLYRRMAVEMPGLS